MPGTHSPALPRLLQSRPKLEGMELRTPIWTTKAVYIDLLGVLGECLSREYIQKLG